MKKMRAALVIATLTYSAIACLSYATTAPLSHDEHQFMASAFMVVQYNYHPYQDFAYFHMPNLVYLYAPLYLLPYSFLLARIFVCLCSIAVCFMIFFTAQSLFADRETLASLFIPISVTVLFVHSPLFDNASSYVWNHAQSVMFAVLAFLLHSAAIRHDNPSRHYFLSGISLGMAIGIRLTFAPLAAPFLLATLIFRNSTIKEKALHVLVFGAGGLLANLPAIYFFFTSHDDFMFGILGYARLNTIYREGLSFSRGMTLLGKAAYIRDFVFAKHGDLVILIITVSSLLLLGIEKARRSTPIRFESGFLLMLLPFVFMGSVAPTPSFYQYYYAVIPFLILLGIYAISSLQRLTTVSLLLLGVAIFSIYHSSPLRDKSNVLGLLTPEQWYPVQFEREAEIVREYVDSGSGEGAVLTLSPLYVIESGLPIYREFVTGPFAWRVSPLLSEQEAESLGLPLPSRISSFFETNHPRAVLTGRENERLETVIIKEARRFGYQRVETPTGTVIWISP